MPSLLEPITPPTHEGLVADLALLRRKGIVELRYLKLPALSQAVHACGQIDSEQEVEAPALEFLLRQAIDDFGGGRWGQAAGVVYGLRAESRGDSPGELRHEAAETFGISFSRWRNHWEPRIIGQVAEAILGRCHEYQMRLAHLGLERRLPTSSRLAIAWVARFQAYYALWTPIYAIGADLTAFRLTLLEEDRPYDREPTPDDPEGYSQELQAAGYATYALFHFAAFLSGVESFKIRYGGHWLLSDKQAETDVADAIDRIRVSAPFNEQQESFLRTVFAEAGGEMHPFRLREKSDKVLAERHQTWQDFAGTCQCRDLAEDPGRSYFPTHRTHPGIDSGCEVHAIVAAANDYCVMIDDDWDRIADWYHIGQPRDPGVSASDLYLALRERTKERGINQWPPWGQ